MSIKPANFLVPALMLLLCFGSNTPAQPLQLSSTTVSVGLGLYLRYLEDSSSQYRFADVQALPPSSWQQHNGAVFNQGYTDSVFWLALDLEVKGNSNDPEDYFLEFGLPFFGMLDFYLLENGTLIQTYATGLRRQLSDRAYPHESFVFPLSLTPGKEYRIILRGDSVSAMLMPLTLHSELNFHQTHLQQTLLIGLYLGLAMILAIYNLFLFIAIRDVNYLFYTLHVFGLCWMQASLRGFTATHVWGDEFRDFAYHEPTMIIWLTFFSSLLFARSFLKLKALHPRWNKVISLCLLVAATFSMLAFFAPMEFVLAVFNIFSPLAIILVIAVAIHCLRAGNRTARFFLLGWSFFLVSALVKTVYHMGWLPTNFFTTNPMILGSALEGVLLSLALADRINWIQKEKEQAQQMAVEALEHSNRIKDDFLINISHELRTPLAGIVGALSLSKKNAAPHDRRTDDELIEKSTQRMSDTIDSILTLTEMSTGDLKINPQYCVVEPGIRDLIERTAEQCKERGLNFHYQQKLPQDTEHCIDIAKLNVMLTQLLQNAINFTKEGQISLQIEPSTNPNGIRITIEDSGVGIPEDQLENIFAAFHQLSGGYSRTHEGLGIGLTLCRSLADLMAGSLALDSTPGKGTHVTITIPSTARLSQQNTHGPGKTSGILTLVVEDNHVNQKVLVGMLKKLGCETQLAHNGAEALEQVTEQKPDIIFMDCQMPVMDGLEATRRLREHFSSENLPVVAVTANALSNDRERCFAAGMNDYLVKPVKIDTIEEALHKWVTKKATKAAESA